MELQQYAAVIRRRWPLIAAVAVLSVLFSGALYVVNKPVYTAVTRVSVRRVTLPPLAATPGATPLPGALTYDAYYNMYSSEFLADDYAIIVTSAAFAGLVDDRLRATNQAGCAPSFGRLSAERRQREVTVTVNAPEAACAAATARSVADVFTDLSKPGSAAPRLNASVTIPDGLQFAVLDQPVGDGAVSNNSRRLLNSGITVGVGLALALALAFLLEYLDHSLRDSADLARATGLPVLGTIPPARR